MGKALINSKFVVNEENSNNEGRISHDETNDKNEEEEISEDSASFVLRQTIKRIDNSKIVKFVEYAPQIFYMLRKKNNSTQESLQESFNPLKNKDAAFKAGESQGKSGSFFFFTHDNKYLIKTMTKEEFKTFMKFITDYYIHCMKYNNSLIAKILGVFKLKLPDITPMRFFVMENAIQNTNKENLFKIYDLKGSIVHRKVDETNKTNKDTLKDVNLKDHIKENRKVFLTY